MRVLGLVLLISLGLAGVVSAQDTYTITLNTNANQDAILRTLYRNECMRALASNETLPGGCVESPPGQCTCTPTTAQRQTFLARRLVDAMAADRRALHESRGSLYRERYPNMSKADRDICDQAAGFEVLE